jgi:hypothetical protein
MRVVTFPVQSSKRSCAIRLLVTGFALIVTTGAALAGTRTLVPPGGPAPTWLIGTWRTTLTRADVAGASSPAHMPAQRTWELVLSNDRYLKWPRALGLRPAGQGGDVAPFGFEGSRLYVECLAGDQGTVASGHGTYAWSLHGKALRFRLVSEPCTNRDLRNRIAILTSEPWTKVR